MAALFDGTTQYFTNAAAPVTGYPFTVAAWAFMTADGAIFSLSDTGTTNNLYGLRTGTAKVEVIANAAGAQIATTATAQALNTWFFAVGRFISAGNRRVSVLHDNGSIEHAQNTTATTPTGIDTATIGVLLTSGAPSRFWPGLIGEFWWTNSDIQPDGGQLDDNMVRQLAYHGPFSVPSIVPDIIEYHQMRSSSPVLPNAAEDFVGKLGPQTWVNNAGVTTGHHPPLPYEYNRPRPVARMLTI